MATLIFKKNNRVINAPDTSEVFYLNEGYDEVKLSEDGKSYELVKAGKRKTVPYAEFAKVQDELSKLKADISASDEKKQEESPDGKQDDKSAKK
ncbi:hypothetical protein [Sporolactobacillus laevolacticus]|uniref:Uncharacterized protein n=1 Tax=Sporolactobacillus laevolacticus DSM 442 TaxID=1395513 RepID=V6IVQ5_9BACL|nr:hypothetical protein [Sporolactobacillus laevolacticus]EST11262.1 hypothetical protein P343_12655 [Sporolactobacillus laevolacticus DSM 442]